MLRFQFLWGLDLHNTGINNNVPFNKVFMAQSGGIAGPLNSLYIGFKFNDASPIGCNFTVHVTINATGILEGSIVTNLPSASGA